MDQHGSSSATPPIADAHAARQDALKQLADVGTGTADGSVWSQLLSNPFFTAGFGLAGLGAALRYGSQGLRRAGDVLRHRMLVDLEITRHDKSYPWVLDWMTSHYQNQLALPPNGKQSGALERLIQRFTPGLHHLQINTDVIKTAGGSVQTAFALVPGHGRHILRYKNAFIAVNRERVGRSFDNTGQPFETVKLTTLYAYRHIFEDIFREAQEMAMQRTEGKTVVYTTRNMGWEESGQPKRRRPFDSVVLEEGLSERILNDVQEFLHARTWYLDRGIPYRRGYLLYALPCFANDSYSILSELIVIPDMARQVLAKLHLSKPLQVNWTSTSPC